MKKVSVLDRSDGDRLQLFFHLIPVIGFFPSLWTLYQHQGDRTEQGSTEVKELQESFSNSASQIATHYQKEKLAVSRLSVTLALAWAIGYFLLGAGAETSGFLTFRLLMLNSLLTSGYFLVSVWLMLRLAARKSVRLPGFTTLANRAIGK